MPAGAWECELWSRLYGSPSISRKAIVYSTPITEVSLSSLPCRGMLGFLSSQGCSTSSNLDAQDQYMWWDFTEYASKLPIRVQMRMRIWELCTSFDVLHHMQLLPGVEAHLGTAWAALRHPAPPRNSIMAGRSRREVVRDLWAPSGCKRLPHVLHILLTGACPQCTHACTLQSI